MFSPGFPGGSDGKESAYNAGDPGLIPGLERSPREGNDHPPTPVFIPGEFHGQRSLVGYSLCGSKQLNMTEQLTQIRLQLYRLFCSNKTLVCKLHEGALKSSKQARRPSVSASVPWESCLPLSAVCSGPSYGSEKTALAT